VRGALLTPRSIIAAPISVVGLDTGNNMDHVGK